MWAYHPRLLWNRHKSRKAARKFKAGTTFLEHGTEPAVVIYMDEYDGYNAVSMVDGKGLAGSVMNCGPVIMPWRQALDLAYEMREEREKETRETVQEPATPRGEPSGDG